MTNCLRNAHPDHTVRLSPLQIIATRPLLACVALHWVTGAKLCSIWDAILLDRAVGICEIRSRRVPRSRRNVTKRTFLPGRIVLLLTIVSPFERSTLCFLYVARFARVSLERSAIVFRLRVIAKIMAEKRGKQRRTIDKGTIPRRYDAYGVV